MSTTVSQLLSELDRLHALYRRQAIEERLIAFIEGQRHEQQRLDYRSR